jgi:hypothetical protein
MWEVAPRVSPKASPRTGSGPEGVAQNPTPDAFRVSTLPMNKGRDAEVAE